MLKNVVFWDVTLCKSCVNRRFGGTSVNSRFTQRHFPEDDILHSHRSESLKFYTILKCAFEKEAVMVSTDFNRVTIRQNIRLLSTRIWMKSTTVCNVTPCSLIVYRRFGETCRFHLHKWRLSWESNQRAVCEKCTYQIHTERICNDFRVQIRTFSQNLGKPLQTESSGGNVINGMCMERQLSSSRAEARLNLHRKQPILPMSCAGKPSPRRRRVL
jgi:hypothetical protein